MKEEIPVFTLWYEVVGTLLERVSRFPRSLRPTLENRMLEGALDVLREVVRRRRHAPSTCTPPRGIMAGSRSSGRAHISQTPGAVDARMRKLALSLTLEQIRAANRLHAELTQWRLADQALMALRERFPEFDSEATLLKAAAINSFYGTNVYSVTTVGTHVHDVLAGKDLRSAGPELVDEIACVPGGKRYVSFASKFAHFFIDAERFPIKDSVTDEMVELHLGKANLRRDTASPYTAFAESLKVLRELTGFAGSNRELDRYLWIRGQYRRWQRDGAAGINREAVRLFAEPPDRCRRDLLALTSPESFSPPPPMPPPAPSPSPSRPGGGRDSPGLE